MSEQPSRSDYPAGFDQVLGLEYGPVTDDEVVAEVAVRDEIKQPAGLVHGGVYAAMAESMASAATYLAVASKEKIAMGLSNQTSFLRPISEGTIHGVARRRHAGRSTWVWDVEISDDQGRLCAVTRMTVAVRDRPGA